MFTDMVESTQLAQRDERSALGLIEEQEKLARPVLASHHGRWVKSTGDGFLAEFSSALDAVECAVEFQGRVRERNRGPGVVPLRIRVGVHLGDVQRRAGDIFGDAVNVAARVESAAEAGGICISGPVYDLVRNKVSYALEAMGAQTLKGVAEPVELYRVAVAVAPGKSGPPSREPSVPRLAVLPLTNISPDPKDEYFADGLTEELISVLSKIPGLRVIARTSVIPYKSTPKSVAQIGTELGVGSILEGSVRKAGDRLRISLQLIDAASQEHVWAESYDRQMSDVFAIQTEVAESTAKAIRVELSDRAREFLSRPPTANLQAYDLYLRALLKSDEVTAEAFRDSVALLDESVRLDPQFALAYALLGDRYVQGAGDFLPHHEGFARARSYVTRALEIDPDLSEAHASRANLAMQEEHDWALAGSEFERAVTLNPSNARARMIYATLLRTLGKVEEAERQLWAAAETDPKWWVPRYQLIDLALDRGDLALANERLRQLMGPELPTPMIHLAFALHHAERGRLKEARNEIELAGPATGLMYRIARALVLAAADDPGEARALLAELTGDSPHEFVSVDFITALYVVVGEKEKALDLIESSVREGESGLWLRYKMPMYDPIRDDPRFVAALRSFHLPEEVTRTARVGSAKR
jgi:TolB-like protein/Tfp pilus assembly protein PilF